jgi:MFS family permease
MAEPTTNEHARRRPAASAEVLGNNESGHRDRAVRTRQRDSEYRIGGNCQKIDVCPADAIWVTNAYQFAVVISLLPLASLGDIFGYRRIYVIGLAIQGTSRLLGQTIGAAVVALLFSYSLPAGGTSPSIAISLAAAFSILAAIASVCRLLNVVRLHRPLHTPDSLGMRAPRGGTAVRPPP